MLPNAYILVIPGTSTVEVCSRGAEAPVEAGQAGNPHQEVKPNEQA